MEDEVKFSDGSSGAKFVASMFDLGAFDANPDKAGRLAEFGRLSERSHNFGLMKTQLLKSQEDVRHQQLTVEALNETLKESKANQKFMETQLAAMRSQVVSYQQEARNHTGQLEAVARSASEHVKRQLATLQMDLVSVVKKAGLQKQVASDTEPGAAYVPPPTKPGEVAPVSSGRVR